MIEDTQCVDVWSPQVQTWLCIPVCTCSLSPHIHTTCGCMYMVAHTCTQELAFPCGVGWRWGQQVWHQVSSLAEPSCRALCIS